MPCCPAEVQSEISNRNDRDIGEKNGMLGTVRKVSASKVIVTLDGDEPRAIQFDPRSFQDFDHGYAVTIHKSQGATVDQAYVLASSSMDRHLAYVAMTRHREDQRGFLSREDHPKWTRAQELGRHRRDAPEPPKRSGPTLG